MRLFAILAKGRLARLNAPARAFTPTNIPEKGTQPQRRNSGCTVQFFHLRLFENVIGSYVPDISNVVDLVILVSIPKEGIAAASYSRLLFTARCCEPTRKENAHKKKVKKATFWLKDTLEKTPESSKNAISN